MCRFNQAVFDLLLLLLLLLFCLSSLYFKKFIALFSHPIFSLLVRLHTVASRQCLSRYFSLRHSIEFNLNIGLGFNGSPLHIFFRPQSIHSLCSAIGHYDYTKSIHYDLSEIKSNKLLLFTVTMHIRKCKVNVVCFCYLLLGKEEQKCWSKVMTSIPMKQKPPYCCSHWSLINRCEMDMYSIYTNKMPLGQRSTWNAGACNAKDLLNIPVFIG